MFNHDSIEADHGARVNIIDIDMPLLNGIDATSQVDCTPSFLDCRMSDHLDHKSKHGYLRSTPNWHRR
jgi:hypothetical protein